MYLHGHPWLYLDSVLMEPSTVKSSPQRTLIHAASNPVAHPPAFTRHARPRGSGNPLWLSDHLVIVVPLRCQQWSPSAATESQELGRNVTNAIAAESVSPGDYAQRHGVSKNHILRLISEGVIPHYRLGRVIRINPTEADFAIRGGAGD